MKKSNKINISLDEVMDMNINIVQSNGVPAIALRKIISTCDKNMPRIKEIIEKTLYDEETEIIIPVRLQIFNKPLAKGKLIEAGILKP
ncbi:MAG TPA: hypothetical protein PKN54_02280 [Candidatus Cloacimonas acidaminovorans]|nr:hypothetical protein [Candidatus Cloacimonas acidaminovorans]